MLVTSLEFMSEDRYSVHRNDNVASRNWDGFRMLLDSSKAPGQRTGPESHGFLIQICGWITDLTNKKVNSDSTVRVLYCAVV